jgi:hypothetical protein
MATYTAVDGDPFAEQQAGPKLTPVDGDPFAAAAPEPVPQASDQAPPAFLDRVNLGQSISRIASAAAKEGGEGMGEGTPTGFENETLDRLIELGIFHDPLKSTAGPLRIAQGANEMLMMPAAQLWQGITRATAAGIHGAGGAYGQLVSELGGSQGDAARAKRDMIGLGEWGMIEGGMGRFARTSIGKDAQAASEARGAPNRVLDQDVGVLPRPEDFTNGAKVLAEKPEVAPVVEANLRQMWQEDGIHPAEAVHDAESDAFIKHEITTPQQPTEPAAPEATSGETAPVGGYPMPREDFEALSATGDVPVDAPPPNRSIKVVRTDTPVMAGILTRAEDVEAVHYDLVDADGEVIGYVHTSQEKGSKELKIDNISAWDGPNALGTSATRSILRQLRAENPDVDTVGGLRISGARHGGKRTTSDDQGVRASVNLHSKEEEAELEGLSASLSAAMTPPEDMPPLVSPRVQPASLPGQLTAAMKGAASTLFDIGRDAQMLVAPMARGTNAARAMAKDFANSMRRNRWDWARIDEDIKTRFDAESRARMWNAADEESTSLQLKEPEHMREHQGLTTLEPEEKALVDDLQSRAQNAWLRAQDVGIVKEGAEGLPSYTPRMVMNIGTAFADDKALPLNSIGNNLKIRTAQLLHRKHMTVEETEAAAKEYVGMREALKGKSAEEIQAAIDKVAVARDIRALPLATSKLEDAIAGRTLINGIRDYGKQTGTETVVEGAIPAGETKFFTLDHPAFRSWRPRLKDGDVVKDAAGNPVFEQVPIYVHGDFEGPLRAVLTQKSGPLYGAAMAIKGKTMSLIMNSPMIHNAVEWGRAVPALPGKVATFKVYFEGNRAKKDVAVMHEAIDAGLVPIGHRFFNQDITSMMEQPDLTPGRSWTAKVLGFVPGLFDEGAGNAVKGAIDKAGDFWHNTLLWDRVADLQMGLYTNFRADAMAKGIDQQTASRMAAHWANRYAGALPKEAMSDAATKVSNMLMFSRSFTIGNLGVLKDVFTGLPKDVIAQIERDAGFGKGSIDAADTDAVAGAIAYAKTTSRSMARRKAMAVVALDMGLMYVGNSILQNVMNVLVNDSTVDKEMHGYATRFQAKLQSMKEHPLELVQPLKLLEDLSATSENEPDRKDRVRVGSAADGTSIYARNPVGKIGDEFLGYMTGPLDMMRKKMGTIARPAWQIMNNDAGFGRKVYDPDADTPAKYLTNIGKIVAHIAGSQLPEGQIGAASDLIKGEGDKKVNLMQALGPFAGVTFSKGAPGGPAVGEMYSARAQHDFQVNQALPDIRKQILRGDIPGAQDQMKQIGIPAGLQRFYIRSTLNPATRMSPKAVKDFYGYATPEQKARFLRDRQQPQPAP